MKKLYIAISCLFLFVGFISSDALLARTRTRLGVFYLPEPELFEKAQLRVTRAIINDYQFEEIYRQIDSGKPVAEIKQIQMLNGFRKAGVDLIVTLRWPLNNPLLRKGSDIVNGFLDPASMIDRVPQGADAERALQILKRFLNDFGEQIAVISLQNECLGGPGKYRNEDIERAPGEFSPAGKWLKTVAETIIEARRANKKLANLKISSPAWQAVERLSAEGVLIPEHHKHPKIMLLGEIVKISNAYCDYVDIHPLETSLDDLPRVIAYVKKHTALPLITTEWAGLYQVREWLKEPVDDNFMAFLKKEFPKFPLNPKNNEDLIRFAHNRKTSPKIWNKFLENMPHEKDFALRSLKLFEKEGFVYACWALGYQYNNFVFDLNTLFANMVTNEPFAPNEPAYSDFQRAIEYSGGKAWNFQNHEFSAP